MQSTKINSIGPGKSYPQASVVPTSMDLIIMTYSYLTQQKSKWPTPIEFVREPWDHDGQPEEEVSGRQGRDEQVGRTLEVGVGADAHDDEAVAEDGDECDEGQQAGLKE